MTVLACDLGGTRMKIGIVRDGRVLAQTTEPANSKTGLAPGLPALKNAWLRLLGELKIAVRDCAGISVAFPSLVDAKSSRILAEYGKYADAINFDFPAWAQKEFNLPLAIENDARLALVGEWKYGAARGSDNIVMITLGTGLGTAAIIEGKLLRGKHGQAGVLGGHSTVRYGGRDCNCGNVGCAEAEASTAFLEKIALDLPEWNSSSLRKLTALNYADVFKYADAGDACALKLREHSLCVWATLAVNLIHAYDPEIVVLGGGVMAGANAILPDINDYVRRHAHTPWGNVRVVAGELGDKAALVAGEWLLRERFQNLK
ncbi:MAG: ROK family protein [Limisphaerales bacterium]